MVGYNQLKHVLLLKTSHTCCSDTQRVLGQARNNAPAVIWRLPTPNKCATHAWRLSYGSWLGLCSVPCRTTDAPLRRSERFGRQGGLMNDTMASLFAYDLNTRYGWIFQEVVAFPMPSCPTAPWAAPTFEHFEDCLRRRGITADGVSMPRLCCW